MTASRPPLALTMGEPAGIGGEIACKAWLEHRGSLPPFVLIDDPARLRDLVRRLGWRVPIAEVAEPADAATIFPHSLPVLPQPLSVPAVPGRWDAANSNAVRRSIERAVALVREGRAAAVVTNPLHKEAMAAAGFPFPGHTEFLGQLAGGARPVMMLACPGLRVVPVTVHLSLRQAVESLSREAIVACGRVTAIALARDFGLAAPRLAVAALNPHAGEGGTMGREEIDIIAPAVRELAASGLDVFGPLPADTLFHEEARARYDAVLCMYHDQALIPLKTIDFVHGVNITLGLPFVRTSPDHGTALDIAGTGRADERSLVAALETAAAMAERRAGHG